VRRAVGTERPLLTHHVAGRLPVGRPPPEYELLGSCDAGLDEVQPDAADPMRLVEPEADDLGTRSSEVTSTRASRSRSSQFSDGVGTSWPPGVMILLRMAFSRQLDVRGGCPDPTA